MKKNFFLRGCLLTCLIASVILAGCPGPADPGTTEEDPATLSAPANVERIPGPTSVNITWENVSGATRYQIHITDGDEFDKVIEVTEETAYTVEGLETDVMYTFRIRAGNGRGWSDNWSEEDSVTTQTLLDVSVEIGDTALGFSWDATLGAINYQIQYRPASATTWEEFFVTATSYEIPDLVNFMMYQIRVRPMTLTGAGEWSRSIFAVPLPPAPAAPDSLALATLVPIVINASWDEVVGLTPDPALGGNIQTRYKVMLGTTADVADAEQIGESGTASSVRLGNLLGNVEHYVWVSAQYFFNADAQTDYGPAVMASITTLPGNRDLTPRLTTATGGQIAFEIGGSDRDNELNFVEWSPLDPDNDPNGLDRAPVTFGGPLGEWINSFYDGTSLTATSDWHREQLSGVIATQWGAVAGASSYNMYVATLPATTSSAPPAPSIANAALYATGITKTSHFVRDVEVDTWHYIWVLAANEHGEGPVGTPYVARIESARSLIQTGSTWSSFTHYERGDYARTPVLTILGEGTVHLSWDRADRSTWYEVYYSTDLEALRHTTGGTTSANNREMHGDVWSEGNSGQGSRRQVPYRPFHRTASASQAAIGNLHLHTLATPWNDKEGKAGNPGEIHKIHALETTITGLDPTQAYWFVIRSPNHNGERGYVRVPWITTSSGTNISAEVGIRPTLAGLTSPANVTAVPVSPGGGGRLIVNWDAVPGALTYRVYFSNATTIGSLSLPFINIPNPATTTVDLIRLDPGVPYSVWVIATGENNSITPFGPPIVATPSEYDGTEPVLVLKNNVDGGLVQNMLYIEVNDNDPRIAMGYILENTGEQFFDSVILFAANLRVRNCAIEGSPSHRCTKSGPHLHYNGNVHHILDDVEQYIRPLQRAGIRVSLGTLPDHDNFTYHSLGPWFAESSFPWYEEGRGNPGVAFHSWWTGDPAQYPFDNELVINGFVEELVSELERLGLDGFDMDDEWSTSGIWTGVRGVATTPGTYGAGGGARDRQVTQNYANLIYRVRQRMNASESEQLNNNRGIISLYRFGAPRNNMVGDAEFGPGTIAAMAGDEIYTTGDTSGAPNIWSFLTKGAAAMYPESLASNWFGIAVPRAQYAPNTAGFHNFTIASNSTQNSDTNLYRTDNPFQWKIWYGMDSGIIEQNINHINRMSVPVYGQSVIYVGPDFPQNWIKW